MKQLIFLCTIFFMSVVFLCSTTPVQATAFSFGDDSIFWPGWGNGIEDHQDVIGVPDLIGGSVEIVDGILTQVTFNYAGNDSRLRSGDLFIDLGSDAAWDFVAQEATLTQYQLGTGVDLSSNSYLLSNETWSYTNGNIRDGHPVSYILNEQLDLVIGNGFLLTDFNADNGKILFAGLEIPVLSEGFTIGFTPNCANDVVYERVSVPEPGSMLLLGAFMIGMATVGRKKVLKK